jgi:polyisoprenoid-binding protein YceI
MPLYPVLIALVILLGCRQHNQAAASPVDPIVIPVSDSVWQLADGSSLSWKGKHITGGGHEGYLLLEDGRLQIGSGKVTAGFFSIDMNAIGVTDIKNDRGRKDLEEHLRNEDFFDVKRFPKAWLTIQSVTGTGEQVRVKASLNLRGIAAPLEFPAMIRVMKDSVLAQAQFSFDRTRWGVMHQANNFLSTVKDGIIDNDIKIGLNLVFRKPKQ